MARIERRGAGRSFDVVCETAAQFLKVLRPVTGMFPPSCIFRGVPSISHDLIPSAHRKGKRLFTTEYTLGSAPRRTIRAQCQAEFYTLDKFFTIAARQGMTIPEDSYVLRTELDAWRERFASSDAGRLTGTTWPSPQLFSLIALAQHYGIPTRALDWTWNPYAAAYFAARPALHQPAASAIAVWVFDDFTRQFDRMINTTSKRPLVTFSVSGADNENLRAQRGLFMIQPYVFEDKDRRFSPRPYDRLLLQSLPVLRDSAYILRVVLRQTEVPSLLAHLAHAGVTAGALYPSLWGVAREYEDEQLVRPADYLGAMDDDNRELWNQI